MQLKAHKQTSKQTKNPNKRICPFLINQQIAICHFLQKSVFNKNIIICFEYTEHK